MTGIHSFLSALHILPIALLAGCATTGSESFQAALAMAQANSKTPAGEAYDQRFGDELPVVQTVEACADKLERPELDNFRLLLQVSATGKILQHELHPSTNLSRCLAQRIIDLELPQPPAADYWVELDIQIE